MNNIKWYYEATSQDELDYLLEYCEKAGFNGRRNLSSDFISGCKYIGVLPHDGSIYCTANQNLLLGELTPDIEVFKAQFKTETKADLIAQRDALNKLIAEMEAEEPLSLFISQDTIYHTRPNTSNTVAAVPRYYSEGKACVSKESNCLYVPQYIKLKIQKEATFGATIITFHKKQS